jgi:glucose/arabinose dehydrogenase
MRRMTAVVAICLCTVTGCRGGAAQEPYDGISVTTRGPSTAVPIPKASALTSEPMASEVNVPWTIALLSDAEVRTVEEHDGVVHVEPAAAVEEPSAEDEPPDLEVAVEHDRPDEKQPANAKSCPGVVKGRS